MRGGVFLNQGGLPLRHPFSYICFFYDSTQFKSQSVVDGREFFLNQNPCRQSWSVVFQFNTFFSVTLSDSRCISALYLLRVLLILFSYYWSLQAVMLLLFPYFTPNWFCFLCILLLGCPRTFSTYLLVEISFVILAYPVLLVMLDLVSVSFKKLFFHQNFWFISSLPELSAVLFWSFHTNISLRVFPSLVLVAISSPVLV